MAMLNPASRPMGQRERNKIDKLRRIKDAARELFIEKGFDDTMTREIAIRAGVGLGTIFIYAANKRDLLFLIVNDELENITKKPKPPSANEHRCWKTFSMYSDAITSFFDDSRHCRGSCCAKWCSTISAHRLADFRRPAND